MTNLIAVPNFHAIAYVNATQTERVLVVGISCGSGQPQLLALRSTNGATFPQLFDTVMDDVAAPPTIQPRV